MKERIQVIDFKYKISTIAFMFFLLISTLAPLSGNDWANALIGSGGIENCIKNIDIHDGNIISDFLAPFLIQNKLLFGLIFSALMSLFITSCNNIMGYVKNKFFYLFPFIGTLLVSTFMFSYNYISVSSTVTYTFPAIMVFLYFERLWKKDNKTFSIKEIFTLSLMAIYISMSSLHIAIPFFIGNIIYYIYSLKTKRISSKKYLIIPLIQLALIILNLCLIEKNVLYSNINIALSNLPKYIDTIFSKNIILIILGAIPINFYLSDKLNNWVYKRLVIVLFDLILIFSLAYNFSYYSPVNINLVINKYFGIFATENWYYIFYFIIYIVLFFLSIKRYITNKKTNYYIQNFSIMSFIISMFLIISPIWDEGNVIFIALFLIMTISVILKELDIKIYAKTTIAFLVTLLIYYVSMFTVVQYIDYTRGEYIKEQLEENHKIIEVKANPIYLVWRHNPTNVFQQKDFKSFYNIPKNNQITVKYFGLFEEIEKKVKE